VRILVTGASGFIGRHLVERLAELPGVRLRVTLRRPETAPAFEARGIDTVLGDLTDEATVTAAVAGIDRIVHAAGVTRAADPALLQRVNAEATGRLAAAAREAGEARLLLLSSLAARGPDRRAVAGDAPVSAYGASKLAGEHAVAAALPADRTLILRLGAVYGPGDRDLLPLFVAASRGMLLVPTVRLPIQPLYVGDLAELLASLVARSSWPGAGPWPVVGPDRATWAEAADSLARAVGRPGALRVPLPPAILRVAAALQEFRAERSGEAPRLDRRRVADLVQHAYTADPEALTEATGWLAPTALEDGLARTAAGYRSEGWL
jgi:nucleoside-diphosphate-sugar epimerase